MAYRSGIRYPLQELYEQEDALTAELDAMGETLETAGLSMQPELFDRLCEREQELEARLKSVQSGIRDYRLSGFTEHSYVVV